MSPFQLRLPTRDDLRFIRNSWFESYRKGGRAPLVGFDTYSAGMNPLIDRLLTESVPAVAYFVEVPDEIAGWTCRDAGTVHYIYVKQAYRRQGIATQLAEAAKTYTLETRAGNAFAKRLGIKFNPFLLY